MLNKRRRFLLIALFIVAFAAVVMATLAKSPRNQSNKGTVQIAYSVPSTRGLTVRFNKQSTSPKSSYSLLPGKYMLSITGAGYMSFTTSFTLGKGQTVLINAKIQLKTVPSITSTQQLTLYGQTVSRMTITHIAYFYGQTWAVLTTQDTIANYVIVAQYIPADGSWNIVLGPGSAFNQSSLSKVPALVASYMTTNSYVNPGS